MKLTDISHQMSHPACTPSSAFGRGAGTEVATALALAFLQAHS